MSQLTLKLFDVMNGDCIVLEFESSDFGAVDFSRVARLEDHPLRPAFRGEKTRSLFACLTHPHRDHIGSDWAIWNVLDSVAAAEGQFWHTMANPNETLKLLETILSARPDSLIIEEFLRLHSMISVAYWSFPAERVRRLCTAPSKGTSSLKVMGATIDVLNPDEEGMYEYVKMLRRVANNKINEIDRDFVNRSSAVLRIRYGSNTILLGGDALKSNWLKITGRLHGTADPMNVQAVKASHHGAADSFYDELWDDLFGSAPGIILVSADGTKKPSDAFLNSFQTRMNRGIKDVVYCTGLIDPAVREESLQPRIEAVLARKSHRRPGARSLLQGTIEVVMPETGPLVVHQPFRRPVGAWYDHWPLTWQP